VHWGASHALHWVLLLLLLLAGHAARLHTMGQGATAWLWTGPLAWLLLLLLLGVMPRWGGPIHLLLLLLLLGVRRCIAAT
jgi:hypothetical protein